MTIRKAIELWPEVERWGSGEGYGSLPGLIAEARRLYGDDFDECSPAYCVTGVCKAVEVQMARSMAKLAFHPHFGPVVRSMLGIKESRPVAEKVDGRQQKLPFVGSIRV